MNSITLGNKTFQNNLPPHVSKKVSEALRRIGGLTPHGDPYLRLVWGQKETVRAFGEERMKYLGATAVVRTGWRDNLLTGVTEPVLKQVDIGIPFFVIEEWYSPEEIRPNYDEEVLGAFPERGAWKEMLRVKTADGEFKLPDAATLSEVQELWGIRNAKRDLWTKGERPPAFWREQAAREAAYTKQQADERRGKELKERFRSSLAPHIHRLTMNNPNQGQKGAGRKRKDADSNKLAN